MIYLSIAIFHTIFHSKAKLESKHTSNLLQKKKLYKIETPFGCKMQFKNRVIFDRKGIIKVLILLNNWIQLWIETVIPACNKNEMTAVSLFPTRK